MKLINFLFLVMIGIIGCDPIDPCDEIYCLNGGTCIDGSCFCPSGYYGVNCAYEVNPSGYDCVNGNCIYVTSNAQYTTLANCNSQCAGNDCFSTPYYGAQTCAANYVLVSPNGCCPVSAPYLGVEKNSCYASCTHAKDAGNNTIVFGTGQTSGGSTNGSVIFWTHTDMGCGDIEVTVGGITQLITHYYGNNQPDCGAQGCATFSFPPGHYSFAASCTGYYWDPGTVEFVSGVCINIPLN